MAPYELIFNSLIMSKFSVCEESALYLAPLWLQIFLGVVELSRQMSLVSGLSREANASMW